MSTLLQINSSLLGGEGNSSRLADAFVAGWQARNPKGRVRKLDLGAQPVPHFDGARLQALMTPPEQRSAEQQALVDYADGLIAELRAADVLVIGLPLYNFGTPSALKAYFDHVARAGVTFRYTANGPVGLLPDRPTYVFAARGGHYVGTGSDVQSGFIRTLLNFIGIRRIEFVYAEGLNIDADTRAASLARAHGDIEGLLERGGVDAVGINAVEVNAVEVNERRAVS